MVGCAVKLGDGPFEPLILLAIAGPVPKDILAIVGPVPSRYYDKAVEKGIWGQTLLNP